MMLEQLRDALRNRVGAPPMDTFYTDPQLDDLINEALQVISTENDWPWLQETEIIPLVVGTRFYVPGINIPDTAWQRTKALSVEGYDALTWLDLQMIRNWPDDVSDVPFYYTIYLEQIYLAPSPCQAFDLRHDFIKQEPRLVAPTDTPIMQASFHFSIIAKAVHLAHLRAGDLPRAQSAKMEYDGWLKRMEGSRMRASSTVRPRTRPGRDL